MKTTQPPDKRTKKVKRERMDAEEAGENTPEPAPAEPKAGSRVTALNTVDLAEVKFKFEPGDEVYSTMNCWNGIIRKAALVVAPAGFRYFEYNVQFLPGYHSVEDWLPERYLEKGHRPVREF